MGPFGGSYFYLLQKGTAMRIKKVQRLYKIILEYENGMTRTVSVRASTREVAENRALKHNPNAISVQRNA